MLHRSHSSFAPGSRLLRYNKPTTQECPQNTHLDSFHYKRATFYNAIKSKVGLVLAKAAALRITLNLDGAPIPARAYAHPSHNTNSRLISTALSHHVPLPHAHKQTNAHST